MSRPRTRVASVLVTGLVSGLALGACGAEPPPEPRTGALEEEDEVVLEPGDRAGLDRAGVESAGAGGGGGAIVREAPATTAPTGAPAAAATASAPRWALVRLGTADAEDEHGALVPTSSAIAFDLDARQFPPRALDPVLHVGPRALHRYTHPRIGTLRFVLAEEALPPDGAEIFLQYGDDEPSRVALGRLSRAQIVEVTP